MLANCKTGFEIAWNSIIEPIVYQKMNQNTRKQTRKDYKMRKVLSLKVETRRIKNVH